MSTIFNIILEDVKIGRATPELAASFCKLYCEEIEKSLDKDDATTKIGIRNKPKSVLTRTVKDTGTPQVKFVPKFGDRAKRAWSGEKNKQRKVIDTPEILNLKKQWEDYILSRGKTPRPGG